MTNSPRMSVTRRVAGASSRLAAAALLVALSACGGGGDKGGGAKPPVQAGYIVVQPIAVPLTQDFSGRAVAWQSSEVRPQVNGLIQRMLFTEGSIVHAGQSLYQIDPSLYRAAVNQAQANLASAQAAQAAADALVDRYKPLADIEAVSGQQYTDAVAAARQAAATVGQARAALDTARINLRFATVPAPIGGRIGRSQSTVGALVTSSQAAPLTTIQQLDPIYIDVQQSSADITRLRRQLAGGGAQSTTASVQVKLEDGSVYPHVGTVAFSEVVVDPATGTVTLRVKIPNPDGLILPGMFLHASFAQAVTTQAYLVPQGALSRDGTGQGSVMVVGADGKAASRSVVADRNRGSFWVVTDGLKPGDRVITEGLGNVKPNAVVRAVPAGSPQSIGAPTKGSGAAAS